MKPSAYRRYEDSLTRWVERQELYEQAHALLIDGASYQEASRTTHIAAQTLSKHYPGYGWTQSEGGKLSVLLKKIGLDTSS